MTSSRPLAVLHDCGGSEAEAKQYPGQSEKGAGLLPPPPQSEEVKGWAKAGAGLLLVRGLATRPSDQEVAVEGVGGGKLMIQTGPEATMGV